MGIGGFMSRMGRRNWLERLGMFFVASKLLRSYTTSPMTPEGAGKPLQLADFQPRSMLHVPETKVPRSRYTVIDVHKKLSLAARSRRVYSRGYIMYIMS